MMKRKNVITMLMALSFTMALTLGGCGGTPVTETASTEKTAVERNNNDRTDKADETDKTDKETKDDKADKTDDKNKTDKESTVKSTKASDNKTNSAKTTGTKSSGNKSNSNSSNSGNSSGNNSKPSSGNNSGNSSKPAHTHSYSSSVTKQPTCSAAGVRTYTCSCGKSYTESIPATGNHTWKDQYELKKIPAQTHTENVWKDVCNGCGAQFDCDSMGADDHVAAVFGDACSSYTRKVIDTVTVIDVPAKEENVYIGTKCTTCGAWK